MEGIKGTCIKGKGNGWINLANLGAPMRKESIYYGDSLQTFFENMPDFFEIHEDTTMPVKVTYVRTLRKNKPSTKDKKIYSLDDWAYLIDINSLLDDLAKKAIKEDWSYCNGMPRYPKHPILWNYLRMTFCRLQHQDRVAYSISGKYAAFNTGLVDHRYMPIIALFKRNRAGNSPWIYHSFVIPGEDNGKILNHDFSDEILPATYTDNSSDMFYDISLGKPNLDYHHIIVERADRLPVKLLMQVGINDLEILDPVTLSGEEKASYLNKLKKAIEEDHITYRKIMDRLDSAVNLAMKRVRWSIRTAVPMFYAKANRLSLLLPLCLADERYEDLALVVSKSPANKYEASTTIPLDWAYADARVISQPCSNWLVTDGIKGSETIR